MFKRNERHQKEEGTKHKLDALLQTVLYDIICIPKPKNVKHLSKTEIQELILDALSNAMRNYIIFSGKDFDPKKIHRKEYYNEAYHWFNIGYGYGWNWIHLGFSRDFENVDYSTNRPKKICFSLNYYQSVIYPNANCGNNNQLCYPYHENGEKMWLKCYPNEDVFWIHYYKAIKRPNNFDYYNMFITKMMERLQTKKWMLKLV